MGTNSAMNVPAGFFHCLEHKFDKGGCRQGWAAEVYVRCCRAF
jgi:hypothetical protein